LKILNNILYLEFSDFPEESHAYLWVAINRNRSVTGTSWVNIPDPTDARRKLILYDSIPETTINKYGIPKKQQLVQSIALDGIKTELKNDLKTLNYYMENKKTVHLAHEYTRIAAWLTLCAQTSPSGSRAKGFDGTDSMYETVIRLMNQEAKEYAWRTWSVENLLVFKRRLKPFNQTEKGHISREEALESLVYKKEGIKNAQKVNDDFSRVALTLYIQKGTGIKLLMDQVYFEYEAIRTGRKQLVDSDSGEILTADQISVDNLPSVCIKTFQNFFKEPMIQVITSKLRDGNKYHNDKFRPYIMRMKPKFSWSMSSSDGETMPFRLIINNSLTYKRATCYMIFDVMSEAIIGYSFSMNENIEVMRDAFSDMLLRHDGLVPHENQLDNFGRGFETELKQIYRYVSFCQPFNPQSKYAERLIGEFEKNHLRKYAGYQGTNNQSKKQSGKKNPDIEDVGYTFAQLKKLYEAEILAWQNSVPTWCKSGKTRQQLLDENKNPDKMRLPTMQLAQIAGESTILSINRGYIIKEVDDVKYAFEVPDYQALIPELQNVWKVRVCYLPNLLSQKVWIYNYKDKNLPQYDTFLAECLAVDPNQASKAEQNEADSHKLGHQKKRVDQFDNWVDQKLAEIPSVAIVSMSQDEAEGILADGYTEKHLMNEAEAVFAFKHSDLKTERLEANSMAKETKKRASSLQHSRFETEETAFEVVENTEPEPIKKRLSRFED
jgi:hypothetical protein